MAAPPRPATLGLATQLRSPTLESDSFSPALSDDSATRRSPQKVTPAMREDVRTSPRVFTMPQWAAKEVPGTASNDGHHKGTIDSVQRDEHAWGSEDGGMKTLHIPVGHNSLNNRSSPQNFSAKRFPTTSPARPPRPDSLSRTKVAPSLPGPNKVSATGAPVFNEVDFSFGQSQHLDLGINLEPVYSTYKASKSTPNVASPANASAEETDTPYAAQVRVNVAQRGEKAPLVRKGSLVEFGVDDRRESQATTSSRSSIGEKGSHEGAINTPRARPPRPASPNGTTRPVGQGLRSSYSGSTTSHTGGNPPNSLRRSSSVYVPKPAPLPATFAPPLPASVIVPTPGQAPQAAILPGSKLPLNLLTLARRTAHISDTPGYAWRVNLLEKLELIMGSFLAVADAEAILSIGNGPEHRKASLANSRKSQIGMANTPGLDSSRPKSKSRATAEPKTFFGRMKRALSNPGIHVPKEAPPPLPNAASRKAVFGTPLSKVAEYGFVTSMIAGQRHDLPGVCFSSVEEIYRRGQGSKVPGLMQLHGEPGRIAKLIQIYDSPPDYGEHHDLSIESIHNATSLLKRYLRDLPEPVLDQRLWRLYLAACVESKNSQKSRIACAQIILRLLPTPKFSLLVYLVAFLSQMPLFPENKLSLEAVSSIFGSSVMAPRPTMEQKKPGKGEMIITGPTESFEAIGQTNKKGQEALLWLLEHWSSIANGLLEPDFDVDPTTILEKDQLVPVLNVEVPPATLQVQPKHQSAPAPQSRRQAPPRPPHAHQPSQEPYSWSPQNKPRSPEVEPRALGIASTEQFSDVRRSYDSPSLSPRIHGNRLNRSPLAGQRASSPAISRSPHFQSNSPLLATPRPGALGTPKSGGSFYGAEEEEQGPPTPQKEFTQPFFSQYRPASQQPTVSYSRQEPGASPRQAQQVGFEVESKAPPPVPMPPRSESRSSPSFENSEEPPQMEVSSSTSSDRSVSIVTPREPNFSEAATGPRKSLNGVKERYRISGSDHAVLDDVLDYDDNISTYSFPSPPLTVPSRPSPFLIPSPFLSPDEMATSAARDNSKGLDSLLVPANLADHASAAAAGRGVKAAPVFEEKLFTRSPGFEEPVVEDIKLDTDYAVDPDERTPRPTSPADVEKLLATMPKDFAPQSSFSTSTTSSSLVSERSREQPGEEDTSDLPSARPPVPQKHNSFQHPRSSPLVNPADFEPRRASLPSSDEPGLAAPALLGSMDDQLLEAQRLSESHRKEVQQLWKRLTDLELERTRERAEMVDLRKEVEGFKERMTRRLSRQSNEQEKKKRDDALERAQLAEEREQEHEKEREEDSRRTKEDFELLKLEAAHARDEAGKAHGEVGELRGELRTVEELRRKEQADAKATIEALEAQLSTIRAVLLGGAGIKI
ncbi:hypothetical protein JCM11641_002975 [Rhodosporidiobolus odoratus]